jgi:CheY-like chemotaxis protein
MLEREIEMKKGPHAIPPIRKKKQLLVVDDNEAVQEILSRIFSIMGHDVTVADNGLEGMALFLAGSYDLVVTDIQMPLMNGWELSRLVKEHSSNTPVVVVTGSYDDTNWEKVNMNRVDAIIPKPFKLEDIQETVQGLLDSGA